MFLQEKNTLQVNIEGLQENFENAVKLYEEVVNNVKADDKALAALKQD